MSSKILISACCILLLGLGLHKFTQPVKYPKPLASSASAPDNFRPDLYFALSNAYAERAEFKELNQRMASFVRRWEIKGASLAIVKDGKLIYARGFGYADEEQKIKAQPYHQFRIASVSKLFTAVAMMKLVEQGKLKLEDKVFGPQGILNDSLYQQIADPLALKIEVHHLLKHTAGWRNQLRTDPMFAPLEVAEIMGVASPPSIETTIQFMLRQQGYFEPGTLYDYSNFGYCLAGKIIEEVSKTPYQQYMQEEILIPAGIQRMHIGKNQYAQKYPQEVRYYPHKKTERKLSAYGTGDSASKAYEATHIEALGPAGGWIATPTDLLRLVNVIDGFDTVPDILSPQSIAQMSSPQLALTDSTAQHGQLLGWKGVDAAKWWRTGSLVGTSAVLVRQHNGISWAFLSNTDTWRGPYFSYEIEAEMRHILARIPNLPQWDLFLLEKTTEIQ